MEQSINTETVKGRRNWGKGTDPPHTHTHTTFFSKKGVNFVNYI